MRTTPLSGALISGYKITIITQQHSRPDSVLYQHAVLPLPDGIHMIHFKDENTNIVHG